MYKKDCARLAFEWKKGERVNNLKESLIKSNYFKLAKAADIFFYRLILIDLISNSLLKVRSSRVKSHISLLIYKKSLCKRMFYKVFLKVMGSENPLIKVGATTEKTLWPEKTSESENPLIKVGATTPTLFSFCRFPKVGEPSD